MIVPFDPKRLNFDSSHDKTCVVGDYCKRERFPVKISLTIDYTINMNIIFISFLNKLNNF
jgi:hypothetical protein